MFRVMADCQILRGTRCLGLALTCSLDVDRGGPVGQGSGVVHLPSEAVLHRPKQGVLHSQDTATHSNEQSAQLVIVLTASGSLVDRCQVCAPKPYCC